MSLLYFDHAASAPRRPDVAEAMEPWLRGVVGNPAGGHRAAREARRAVEESREVIAEFVGAAPSEVVFTAGGTESCHAAIVGAAARHRRDHDGTAIVVSSVEHHAVLDAARWAERHWSDVVVRMVGVDRDGVVDLDALREVVGDDTAVVSVMTANNETGVRQPLDAVGAIARAAALDALWVHTDAVAAAPWLSLPVVTASSDLVSLCAHKLGGPVGAGALVLRRGAAVDPIVPGGGQEAGRRGGTVDVAAVVGFAAAARASARDLAERVERATDLRDRLARGIVDLPGCRVTAEEAARVAGTLHVTVEGVDSDELLYLLDAAGLCASAGASCSSGATEPSHVLAAMGVTTRRARGALRLSLGAETTSDEVDAAIRIVRESVARLAGTSDAATGRLSP